MALDVYAHVLNSCKLYFIFSIWPVILWKLKHCIEVLLLNELWHSLLIQVFQSRKADKLNSGINKYMYILWVICFCRRCMLFQIRI